MDAEAVWRTKSKDALIVRGIRGRSNDEDRKAGEEDFHIVIADYCSTAYWVHLSCKPARGAK